MRVVARATLRRVVTVVRSKPKTLGYIRVSTQEQISGFGIEVQERAIRYYCKANNLRLIGVLRDEGQSGSNGLENRLGLAEALARWDTR
jgi:site-specific DNA recombinase